MWCGNDLAEGEEVLVIKKIPKVRTNISIAKRLDRCVMTEKGESLKIFKKCFKEETSVGLNLFSLGDMNRLLKTYTLSKLKSWLQKWILPPATWIPKLSGFLVDFAWISRGC